jgi:hypothetical protein
MNQERSTLEKKLDGFEQQAISVILELKNGNEYVGMVSRNAATGSKQARIFWTRDESLRTNRIHDDPEERCQMGLVKIGSGPVILNPSLAAANDIAK